MRRATVGVLFGGCSEEHSVSVKSAREVARHLDLDRYEPVYLGITRDGAWRRCDDPAPGWEQRSDAASLSPDRQVHGVLVDPVDEGRYGAVRLDVVLPVLHGRLGEDGAVQGLLELSGIPYVGCDVQCSALCMDKSLTYLVARNAGVLTPTFATVDANEQVDADGLTFPVFVKPARSGSSFGVTKVEQRKDLLRAVAEARRFDSKVLVEEAVRGAEIGCAVLGPAAEPFVGEPDHISLSHGFFRVHQESEPEAGSENSTIVVPADISADERSRILDTAKTVYRALGCAGLARVDLFLTDDGLVVLNEVNTLPGLTSYSRYPRMMAVAGVPLPALLDRLLSAALADAHAP